MTLSLPPGNLGGPNSTVNEVVSLQKIPNLNTSGLPSTGISFNEIWPIPKTNIVLDIISYPRTTMDQGKFDKGIAYLKKLVASKPQDEIVSHGFNTRYSEIQFNFDLARRSVTPATWGDLNFVLIGLFSYVDDLQRYQALDFTFRKPVSDAAIGWGNIYQDWRQDVL